MSGSLSQEEIDALLNKGAEGATDEEAPEAEPTPEPVAAAGEVAATATVEVEESPPADGGTAEEAGEPEPDDPEEKAPPDAEEELLTADERDALGEVGNICMASGATSLAALLGHPVSITAPKVSFINEAQLRADQPRPTTFVQVGFTKGLIGRTALMVSVRDASVIADLMMGGEGAHADELSEMHVSAVSEAMNQMMGASATAMAELVGRRVDISAPEVEVLDLSDSDADLGEAIGEDLVVKVAFMMTVGDLIEAEIKLLMPADFARDLVASLLAPPAERDPEPAPSADAPDDPGPEATPAADSVPPPVDEPAAPPPTDGLPEPGALAHPVSFPALEDGPGGAVPGDIGLLLDVPLHVTVELGRTELRIRNVLDLVPGSIIELDRLAGEPVDVLVNGKNIARGEVVVIDEEFGVRITDVTSPASRLSGLAGS